MNNTSENPCVRFGQFLLSRRKAANKKARIVAEESKMLPSNYSKIETGTANPPKDPTKLKLLGKAIGLAIEDDWVIFRDLAAKANNAIAPDLVQIIGANDLLPRFLRTIHKKQITQADLKKMLKELEE